MDFRDDERGQPVVIGALLVFAILVLAFSGYQVFVVPNQNADVEFTHSQQVQDDMVDLRVGVVRAAISGSDTSTSVRLGTQYPSRLIALNPPPPAGTLRTTEPGDIAINGSQEDNIGICPAPRTTRAFVYEPNYNEFHSGADLVYENTFAYSQHQNGETKELIKTNRRLLDADDGVIELIALEGEFSETGTNRVDVDLVRGETKVKEVNRPEITLPTRVVNRETWEEDVLSGEANIIDFQPGESVTFQVDGRWDVRCTPVGINRAPASGSSSILRQSDGGGGSGSSGITANSISDLEENTDNQVQTFEFDLGGVLADGENVIVDLRNANGGGIDYSYTGNTDPSTVTQGNGEASLKKNGDELTFTAGNGGSEGFVTIEVEEIDVEPGTSGQTYEVTFTRQDSGDADTEEFSVN